MVFASPRGNPLKVDKVWQTVREEAGLRTLRILLGGAARTLLASRYDFRRVGVPRSERRRTPDEECALLFLDQGQDMAEFGADARLHDLRHAHASHAVMNGENLHMAGRSSGADGQPSVTSIWTMRP